MGFAPPPPHTSARPPCAAPTSLAVAHLHNRNRCLWMLTSRSSRIFPSHTPSECPLSHPQKSPHPNLPTYIRDVLLVLTILLVIELVQLSNGHLVNSVEIVCLRFA